jgi:hypothetical protein
MMNYHSEHIAAEVVERLKKEKNVALLSGNTELAAKIQANIDMVIHFGM